MSYIDAMEILMMLSLFMVILLQPTLSEMDRFLFVLHHENIAKIISYKCSIIQYYHFYKSIEKNPIHRLWTRDHILLKADLLTDCHISPYLVVDDTIYYSFSIRREVQRFTLSINSANPTRILWYILAVKKLLVNIFPRNDICNILFIWSSEYMFCPVLYNFPKWLHIAL